MTGSVTEANRREIGAAVTIHASRYLQQLCKHFAHKLPVTFTPHDGHIIFPIGDCRLTADGAQLRIDLAVAPDGDLPQLRDVVIRHLVRFAFREELEFVWNPA